VFFRRTVRSGDATHTTFKDATMTIPGKRGRAASEGRNDDQECNFLKSHDVVSIGVQI
jgi:hypothetical protein